MPYIEFQDKILIISFFVRCTSGDVTYFVLHSRRGYFCSFVRWIHNSPFPIGGDSARQMMTNDWIALDVLYFMHERSRDAVHLYFEYLEGCSLLLNLSI